MPGYSGCCRDASLGVIHFRLGAPAVSARYFALAAEADPGNDAHRIRQQFMEQRARGDWPQPAPA